MKRWDLGHFPPEHVRGQARPGRPDPMPSRSPATRAACPSWRERGLGLLSGLRGSVGTCRPPRRPVWAGQVGARQLLQLMSLWGPRCRPAARKEKGGRFHLSLSCGCETSDLVYFLCNNSFLLTRVFEDCRE